MWKHAALITLAGISFVSANAQSFHTSNCLPDGDYQPTIVSNPENRVTFRCKQATPFDLIRAVGFQARLPIGVVLGEDAQALSGKPRSYDIVRADARTALLKAIEGTGYSIEDEGHAIVLTADDLSPRQRSLLLHAFYDFKPGQDQSMVELGANLTMWIQAAVDPATGFASSILGSTNDERFSLIVASGATTEQIANQIVSQGSKGMWILKVDASSPVGSSTDKVEIEPYQHYSNAPLP